LFDTREAPKYNCSRSVTRALHEEFMKSIAVSVFLLAACAWSQAQVPMDSKPASTNVMGSQYPRLSPDLRASFRLKAPDAQKMQVHVGGADYDM